MKPEQIDELRNAVFRCSAEYLRDRDDAIIATMYDTGLRVGELVALDVEYLRDENTRLYVPGHIQKDYPNDNTPTATRIALDSDTTRSLSSYLANRWKDTDALFPSRSADRITTEGVRQMLKRVAREADVRPFLVDGGRGDPGDVTPHALRHSVAWRMMNAEEGNTMYDVRNRLRHRSIQTTEQVYDHIAEV